MTAEFVGQFKQVLMTALLEARRLPCILWLSATGYSNQELHGGCSLRCTLPGLSASAPRVSPAARA